MAAASCQRCFLCLSFLSTPHFPAAAILEPGLGGGRRNKGSSSTAGILIPLSHRMAGPAINIRLHNTKQSRPAPTGHSPSLRRGKGGKGTALPRAPQGFGTANPLTHKPPARPPLPAGGIGLCGDRPCWGAVPRGVGASLFSPQKKKKENLKKLKIPPRHSQRPQTHGGYSEAEEPIQTPTIGGLKKPDALSPATPRGGSAEGRAKGPTPAPPPS